MLRLISALILWSITFLAHADAPMLKTDGERVPDEYLVVFENPFEMRDMLERVRSELGGQVMQAYESAVAGARVRMSAERAAAMTTLPGIAWIEENAVFTTSEPVTQRAPGNAGLDRIDQRGRALDSLYSAPASGRGVNVYVIDSGINPRHAEFGGRARVGTDVVGDGRNGVDCNGHGTHVAGIAGSRRFGVAKQASLIAIRVFDCSNSTTAADVLAGIDWLVRNAERPAVANLSLGGPASRTLDAAVNNLVASGVFAAVAAGNEGRDACAVSPARASSAFTVGATAIDDRRAGFSNVGACVELFAPGLAITSTWFRSSTDINTISGTSMAAPHVAGAAALLLEQDPTLGPLELGRRLVERATSGTVLDRGAGSPDRLLFVGAANPRPPFVESFDRGPGLFSFRVDALGTNAPAYAQGRFVAAGDVNGSGAVSVRLGGVDDATVLNMSGAYGLRFELDRPARLLLRFGYSVTQQASYEADESSIAVVVLDGAVVDAFGELAGDGNGGPVITTGVRARSVDLGQVAAGVHELLIGGFNDKKTLRNEFTDLTIDDVSLGVAP